MRDVHLADRTRSLETNADVEALRFRKRHETSGGESRGEGVEILQRKQLDIGTIRVAPRARAADTANRRPQGQSEPTLADCKRSYDCRQPAAGFRARRVIKISFFP